MPLLPEPAAKPIRFRGGSEIAVVTWLFSIQQETKAHASERTGPERADRSTMNRDTCTRVDIRTQGERTPETNAREWTYGPRASEQVKQHVEENPQSSPDDQAILFQSMARRAR